MELKDNFTNRYFKPDLVKSQIDMIKETTATDAIAEGFQRYGNLPANNAYAQLDNMTIASVGDGMKAVANNKRQEQIDPILKMTGEINARAAYLEAQMQEQEQIKIQTQQFIKNQAFSFMELSKATAASDTTAANNIARGILQSYKSSSGDPIIGDFDHYHDGNIYYTNAETGEKAALSIPLLLNQSGIAPELFGADYGMMMSSYSPGFKGQYENELALQRQQLEKGRADIANTEAQTSLYGAKTGQAMQELNKQPEVISPERAETQQTIELQKDAIKDIYKSRTEDNFYKSSMKTAEDILKEAQKNPNKYERNLFSRAFDKEGDNIRLNKEQERLHTVGTEIKGAMFKRFGYRNQTEFENLPDISPNKTVAQNQAALKVIQDTYKEMVKGEESAISSFNKLVKSQHIPESSTNLTTDQNTSQASEFVQDEYGNIYRVEG